MNKSKFGLDGMPRIRAVDFLFNQDYQFPEEVPIDLSYRIKISQCSNEQAYVYLTILLFKEVEFEKAPFTLEVEIEGAFIWEDIDSESLKGFLRINAPAVMYSYFRPLVSNLTLSAGLPPLVLPLIDFTAQNDEEILIESND